MDVKCRVNKIKMYSEGEKSPKSSRKFRVTWATVISSYVDIQ